MLYRGQQLYWSEFGDCSPSFLRWPNGEEQFQRTSFWKRLEWHAPLWHGNKGKVSAPCLLWILGGLITNTAFFCSHQIESSVPVVGRFQAQPPYEPAIAASEHPPLWGGACCNSLRYFKVNWFHSVVGKI